MPQFTKLDISFDVSEIGDFLQSTDMWGEIRARCFEGSPHSQVEDIWARYKDPSSCIESGDWSTIGDEHESVWLKDIPSVREISNKLMGFLGGSQLGGVLITKLPAGGTIDSHIDTGWHPEFYDKYYIPIKNTKGAYFAFEGDNRIEPEEGEVWAFRNDIKHWVVNDSLEDRIAMIICIKQSKLCKGGSPCLSE